MIRAGRLLAACLLLAACATSEPGVIEPPRDMGDFKLGYNVVIADNAQKIGPSRDATADEWEALLVPLLEERLKRYEGPKFYHVGVNVDGFALAVPGIPVVAAPKSAIVVSVNVWDDATQTKLTEKPKQLTVLETITGGSIIGKGYTQTREEQMVNLAENAARAVENYLAENAVLWFGAAGEGTETTAENGVVATQP